MKRMAKEDSYLDCNFSKLAFHGALMNGWMEKEDVCLNLLYPHNEMSLTYNAKKMLAELDSLPACADAFQKLVKHLVYR